MKTAIRVNPFWNITNLQIFPNESDNDYRLKELKRFLANPTDAQNFNPHRDAVEAAQNADAAGREAARMARYFQEIDAMSPLGGSRKSKQSFRRSASKRKYKSYRKKA
jgi:hypothetical protein